MRKWWETGVVYQIYPRSFLDTDGDGIGNLAGVTAKLSYLATTLGVDAIWLSPFYPSPQKDFGYDVADYTDVEPEYGTLEDFDELLEQAHSRGLKVIVDIVPNHSSDLHPWFQESRSSRTNPKRDWYVWLDPKPDGTAPNNWLSAFGGSAWEWDGSTQQFYLHSFLKEQPDLNWRNREVREAMAEVFRFWLDRGADGFRIDVAHFIAKDPEFKDNPMKNERHAFDYKPPRDWDEQLHLHNYGHADIHEYYREIRAILDEYDDRFMIGELHEWDWERWASYFGNQDEMHMPFNFAFLGAGWNAAKIRHVVDAVEQAVPDFGWPNYVWGNHDEIRIATRLGDAQSRGAALLLLSLRGTPTIYYGDEIGMREYMPPPGEELDPWGAENPDLNRDGCRTPMQWDGSPMAGFTSGDRAWLALGDDASVRNVAVQLDDPASHLSLYRALLAYRRSHPVLREGDHVTRPASSEEVFVFERRLGSDVRVIAVNTSDEARPVASISGLVALSSDPERRAGSEFDGLLAPHEGVIVEPFG